MAIFGKLSVIKKQIGNNKFKEAFKYLEKTLEKGTVENKRLLSLAIDSFEKVELANNNFALEQVYNSKDRKNCFFESHRKYIDVQFILEGEEIIEILDINELIVNSPYDEKMDLLKYNHKNNTSIIKLEKGDIAIFYPKDGHMPCVKVNNTIKVIKTVIKVPI